MDVRTNLAFICFVHAVAGQCTIPSPLSNGNTWYLSDNSISFVSTGASSATISDFTTPRPFVCDGSGPSTTGVGTEYWGRMTVNTTIVTTVVSVPVGMCFRLTPTSSPNIVGITYRTNLTTASGFTANMVVLIGVTTTTQGQACDAGGTRPEYERVMADYASASVTPITCPSGLQQNFTSFTVDPAGTPSCGTAADVADGVTSSSALVVSAAACPAARTYFANAATASLHCLHSFTRGGVAFVLVANSTSQPQQFYCVAYSTSALGQLDVTVVRDDCNIAQTATTHAGVPANALTLQLTYNATAGLTASTAQQSGSQRAAGAVSLLATGLLVLRLV